MPSAHGYQIASATEVLSLRITEMLSEIVVRPSRRGRSNFARSSLCVRHRPVYDHESLASIVMRLMTWLKISSILWLLKSG